MSDASESKGLERLRPWLGAAIGVSLLMVALLYGCFGTAPTGMTEVSGEVGNQNDATLARWATAALPFVAGLVVLGMVNTQWVTGGSDPRPANTIGSDPSPLDTIDASLVTELNKLVIQLQGFANAAQAELEQLNRRVATLEKERPTSHSRATPKASESDE